MYELILVSYGVDSPAAVVALMEMRYFLLLSNPAIFFLSWFGSEM